MMKYHTEAEKLVMRLSGDMITADHLMRNGVYDVALRVLDSLEKNIREDADDIFAHARYSKDVYVDSIDYLILTTGVAIASAKRHMVQKEFSEAKELVRDATNDISNALPGIIYGGDK